MAKIKVKAINSFFFRPHGFSSDNAGAICAGIEKHFGKDVLHRTCSFHYLFGAYNHCSNAIGQRKDQVRYLRYAWKLLEASSPKQFELIYKFFKAWIEKSKSRQKKLGPWLKFWYDRKVQWTTAYTSLSVDAVNLAEAGQSKYKKNNRMKRLRLYQGCVFVVGDSLLYSSRLKAMTSQNFVGKGPSKEILDLRTNRKEMERIKDQFMTSQDLENLFRGDFRTQNRVKLGKPSQVGGRGSRILSGFPNLFFLRRGGGSDLKKPFPNF